MKTHVNSLKSSLSPKIISPKLFRNSHRTNGSLSENGWSSVPLLTLIFSPTKQPYSKVGNPKMYRYGNAVFTSNFY